MGVLLVVPASAGSAAAAPLNCPEDAYCLFKKAGLKGDRLVVRGNQLKNFPAWINNKASSASTNLAGERAAFFYLGKNGQGTNDCMTGEGAIDFVINNNTHSSSKERPAATCI